MDIKKDFSVEEKIMSSSMYGEVVDQLIMKTVKYLMMSLFPELCARSFFFWSFGRLEEFCYLLHPARPKLIREIIIFFYVMHYRKLEYTNVHELETLFILDNKHFIFVD